MRQGHLDAWHSLLSLGDGPNMTGSALHGTLRLALFVSTAIGSLWNESNDPMMACVPLDWFSPAQM